MGIFSSILKGITGPFRGIAKFAQGDIRGGLGALGSTAKLAAPIIGATGVGLPLAAGLGAAGGAAERWGEGEGNVGKILGGAAVGAAGGAAGHVISAAGPLPGVGKYLGGAARDVGTYAMANPEIGLGVASGAANAYGAEQQGAMQDLQFASDEEERRRRAEADKMRMLMSIYGSSF